MILVKIIDIGFKHNICKLCLNPIKLDFFMRLVHITKEPTSPCHVLEEC